ncbi:hypothetical protein BDV06DRAFT_139186 [Aspergillus oleicola]
MYNVYKEPIPASAISRSKLDAFRFKNNPNNPETTPKKESPQKGHTNKENQTSWLNGVVKQDEPKPSNQQHAPEPTEAKPIKDCPQTPGNRLPLADLIGNAEDAFSRAPVGQEFTPEDYVIWQHAPPSSNQSAQTPATQSKKRHHSSSPSSSPLAGSRGAQKGAFDFQSIQTLLKTPQNDLATDLWNDYVAKTAANAPDLQQPRFANILSSSPHTPGSARTGQDSSGLRRSISCNAEWPSSKAKRRKIGESPPKGRAIFSRTRSNIMVPKDLKTSGFSSLVKEMERSLKKAPANQPELSKISPTTVHSNARRSRSASPLETKFIKPAARVTSPPNDTHNTSHVPTNQKLLQESSSDYGGDDLDDDFFGIAESSMDPFVEPARPNNKSSDTTTDYGSALASNAFHHSFNYKSHDMPPRENEVPNKPNDSFDADEFDADEFDDGFDEFAEDIDQLVAGYDQTPSQRGPRTFQQSPTSKHPPNHDRMGPPPTYASGSQDETKEQFMTSSDEFDDDDFDMDCLDQPIAQGEDSPDDVRFS